MNRTWSAVWDKDDIEVAWLVTPTGYRIAQFTPGTEQMEVDGIVARLNFTERNTWTQWKDQLKKWRSQLMLHPHA